jgi:hypothetical protein
LREKAGDWESAETLFRQAADAGHTSALIELAWMRERAGDREGAETLYRQAADAGESWLSVVRQWPYINGLRFITIEAYDTEAALTATELLRAGHSWAAGHAIHAARPSADFPTGRFLLTLTPELYEGTGVQAVHPDDKSGDPRHNRGAGSFKGYANETGAPP